MVKSYSLALALALFVAACSSGNTPDVATQVDEKSFTLTPNVASVQVGVLKGRLSDLSIVKRVNAQTGEVVYPPQLTGSLTLENGSGDQAVRVVGVRIAYLDGSGRRIALAEGRSEPTLNLYGSSGDRLDPGATAAHRVDVPFPAAALDKTPLAEVRLELAYIPMPYRQESGGVALTVKPQS